MDVQREWWVDWTECRENVFEWWVFNGWFNVFNNCRWLEVMCVKWGCGESEVEGNELEVDLCWLEEESRSLQEIDRNWRIYRVGCLIEFSFFRFTMWSCVAEERWVGACEEKWSGATSGESLHKRDRKWCRKRWEIRMEKCSHVRMRTQWGSRFQLEMACRE